MDPAPAVAVAMQFIECINRGDLQGLVALMTETHRLEVFDEPPVAGRAANEQAWRGYMSAFPAYELHPEQIAERGGVVAILGRTSGSHLGLPDEEERRLSLIWLADVKHGALARWRLIQDSPANRQLFGLR